MTWSLSQTGAQTLLVTTAATGLTLPASPHTRPCHALMYVGTSAIRWRADGTAATSTSGMYVAANGYIDFTDVGGDYSSVIARFSIIRDTSASSNATLEVAYFD